jgi:class 3 adenylate cyclase
LGLLPFNGPTKVIQYAAVSGERLATIGLGVRAAHAGECERRGHDLSGIAVHIASRLLDYAGKGEIVVSRTDKDLTVGAGIVFEERGEAALKGIPDTWQFYLAKLSRSDPKLTSPQ